jgi:hypothetical protein
VCAALPRPVHIGPETLRALPRLAGLIRNDDGRAGAKRALALTAAWPVVPSAPVPVTRLLLPHISRTAPTSARPSTLAQAMGEVIESGAYVVADGLDRRDEQLALLGALVSGASAVEIVVGTDALDDGQVIARAIAGVLR